MPLEQGGYAVVGPTDDNDCAWSLFGVIPVSPSNDTQDAINEAIRHAGKGADGLIQVSVDSFYQHFIVIARDCTRVSGIAIRSTPTPPPAAAPPAATPPTPAK